MDIGMLWFDSDPQTDLRHKVERAADYYKGKYGRTPTVCFLHPKTAGTQYPGRVGDLEVRTSHSVLPHHFWLGVGKR